MLKNDCTASNTVRDIVIGMSDGQFMDFEGSMLSDKADFTDAKIDFAIQTKSVNTKRRTYRDNRRRLDLCHG
jgi:polyisoprenoid-binding protein YceI